MSLTRFYYDPFTEFDRLFDDAFISRFRPSTAPTDTTPNSRLDVMFRPRCVLLLCIIRHSRLLAMYAYVRRLRP